jgi:hypothetical protein
MKFSSFLILFLISIFTYSQEELKFVLFGGPDFSLLDAPAEDSTTVKPLVSPFFGAELRYPITSNSNLDFGTSYFLKSSIDIHYIKYHNHFASVYANYYYSITKGFARNQTWFRVFAHFQGTPMQVKAFKNKLRKLGIKQPILKRKKSL